MTPKERTTIAPAPQAGALPDTMTMIVTFSLDIAVDRDAYYALSQPERMEAIQSLEEKIYCPTDMNVLRTEWTTGHPLVTSGFAGIAEAAHEAARAAIKKYVAARCLRPSVQFPELATGFDGVRYSIVDGRRICIYDYTLVNGGSAAVFHGLHAVDATALFHARVEPSTP